MIVSLGTFTKEQEFYYKYTDEVDKSLVKEKVKMFQEKYGGDLSN